MTLIIGVDCATKARKTGLARAHDDGGRLFVEQVDVCSPQRRPVDLIAEWLRDAKSALLALDAPLGWPAHLSSNLAVHMAGTPLSSCADDLFSRTTDKEIAKRFGKRPLEVGANLIARTAHAALAFLAELRTLLEQPIRLAWQQGPPYCVVAIEVYPAVTSRAHGIRRSESSWVSLPPWVQLPSPTQANIASPHGWDAVLCAIAGADFVGERSLGPMTRCLQHGKGGSGLLQ